ncbi:nucleolar and spindle-associated protein 1 [Tiliqua scincoides]|uniref:nucleolar and spindle-associated protein 1 n=1 Tax=Tiliqua scincoides TaxID=71010 RepID=UPI003461A2D5
MEEPPAQPLEVLRYSQLQHLAKAVGLKANLKADKLLNALKQHFKEAKQEDENTINKRSSSSTTDTEELNSSQLPVNLPLVTKRRRKQKGKEEQRNLENEEKPKLLPEQEIVLEESQGSKDDGAGKTLNQNVCLANSGAAGNVAESSATPSQQNETNSIKRRRVEDFIPVDSFSGKKCRYTGKTGMVSTTPNFKKLHEAQFKKMQSIDEYIERKNKMIKNFNISVNEVKILAKKGNYQKTSPKETLNSNSKTRSSFRGFIFSPHSQRKNLSTIRTPVNVQCSPHNSLGTVNKSVLTRKSAFNSASLSTSKMNVRFSESTRDNEHKRSLTKTPSRKSPFLKSFTPESQQSSTSITNIKGSATKCQPTESMSNSAFTPFKFSGQTTEPTSTKKPVFDLQASLSRPLSYRPHRGKLKPWGKSKENISHACSLKKNYKQPLLHTREERRDRHQQERKQRKEQVLGTRRGVTVA